MSDAEAAARAAPGRLRRLADMALDIVLPPRCLACGTAVATQGTICAACWRGLSFLAPPLCAACGAPFPFDPSAGALCAACIAAPPAYGRARAVLRYDAGSSRIAVAFKHADRTDMAPTLGAWLVRAGAEVLDRADLLVPVPLHRWRLIARHYNQAALLAQAVGRASGIAVLPDALVRTRNTPPQVRLGQVERRRNVHGAFRVPQRREAAIAGRRIVLVDDVLTTGATVEACTRPLLRAGAVGVDVLTLARVVRPAA
ncbi:MAG: ComF family protein [Alphaproteobacteria bacterium]|nr:ComF family protein [Alphaproteobacteria bacterium]